MPVVTSAFLAVSSIVCLLYVPQDVYETPESASEDPDFAIQGEYASRDRGIQVVAQGDGDFQIVVFKGGLPGAGWNGKDRQVIEGDKDDVADLVEDCPRVERVSPTMGAKAPAGSVVLFDGSEASLDAHWKSGARMTDDGLLKQGATSKDLFRDFRIHVEFRTPYMPRARGQARGNSGLYYQGRYETQILDSFGLEGLQNETGGIYSIRKPDLNMCLPPLKWQTYDGEFRAARFQDGKKVSDGVLSVRLNGIVVQRSVPLTHSTTASPVKEGPEPGPIFLQNHSNEVRFRNIWVQPIDSDREARRPLIPSFERFHANDPGTAAGGRLLVGELNCLACHEASDAMNAHITSKVAPILTDVGARLRPQYIWDFLLDPHSVKPGTTMPSVLAGLPESERRSAATALASFLSTTGSVRPQMPKTGFSRSGERLFHEIGCIACHLPRNGKSANPVTSVPLVDLGGKYSIGGLTGFLKEPHKVRPSGRMPGFDLDDNAARDLAHYLVGEVLLEPREPNVQYQVYNKGFSDLPDLGLEKPEATGKTVGLDIDIAGRNDDFSIRFVSRFKVAKAGDYKFHLGSDDGSLLFVDGKKVVDVDGVHPHTTKSGRIRLAAEVHELMVDYSEVGGEQSLTLEIEGPGIARQAIDPWLTLNEDGTPPQVLQKKNADEAGEYVFQSDLVETGRNLFGSLGCAACHQLQNDGNRIPSSLKVPALADCNVNSGCLGSEDESNAPVFDLNAAQLTAVVTAISSEPATTDVSSSIRHTMSTFNCYACHQRGDFGGPEPDRRELFVSRIPEMGDEGRLPPPLTGVGDKLQRSWLSKLLKNGAKDRPYMVTRMPKFGSHAEHLALDFVKADRITGLEVVKNEDVSHRLISNGRKLVGSEGLSCVKCHTFGKYKATGIQALDLQTMAQRINEDWFHRYLPAPEALRPGTRMPTAFPNGRSVVSEIYEGNTESQVAAIWEYLNQGKKAKVPLGVAGGMIELKPTDRPIIYRNFIQGLTPRGIAVGYPEKANLAWDANRMSLALIWHGRFIDSAMHWQGRGQGRQEPLGDNSLKLESTVPVAALESLSSVWPSEEPKLMGYRFLGYRLDELGRPTFRYSTSAFVVEDTPIAVTTEKESIFRRSMVVEGSGADSLYFRAASGDSISDAGDGTFVVDGAMKIRIVADTAPVVRQSDGRTELLVPLATANGRAELIQEIAW